jgi:hypothetical protein
MRSNSKNDPIFDAIKLRQKLIRQFDRVDERLTEAEFKARKARAKAGAPAPTFAEFKARHKAERRPGGPFAELQKELDRAQRAIQLASEKMARTKPTTAAGVGALIALLRRELVIGTADYHLAALKTAASACAALGD